MVSRPILVAALVASLLLSGCGTPQTLPAGQDPQALAETIARRGQGDAQGEIDPSTRPLRSRLKNAWSLPVP
jgi:predicted small secreted protein